MKKRITFVLVTLSMSLLSLSVQAEEADGNSGYKTSGDKGFDTPEESISYFAHCLAESSLDKAVSAFAVDHYIDGMDYTAYLEWLQSWSTQLAVPLSPEDELSRQLDKAAMREDVIQDIQNLCLGLSLEISWEVPQRVTDAEAFLDTIALADLSSLDIQRTIYADPNVQDSENYRKNTAKLCGIYGCGDIADYYVIYTLQEQLYVGAAQFVEYDGQWYLYRLCSPMTGLSTADVMPISEQQYGQLLEELGDYNSASDSNVRQGIR